MASSSVGGNVTYREGEVALGMDNNSTLYPESSKSASTLQKGKGRAFNQNTHLKGRQRFSTDLADMKNECKMGFVLQGLTVKSAFFLSANSNWSLITFIFVLLAGRSKSWG
jgi:hypothetical protein